MLAFAGSESGLLEPHLLPSMVLDCLTVQKDLAYLSKMHLPDSNDLPTTAPLGSCSPFDRSTMHFCA